MSNPNVTGEDSNPDVTCARCGNAAEGLAVINGERYCHGDWPDPSCYMLQSWKDVDNGRTGSDYRSHDSADIVSKPGYKNTNESGQECSERFTEREIMCSDEANTVENVPSGKRMKPDTYFSHCYDCNSVQCDCATRNHNRLNQAAKAFENITAERFHFWYEAMAVRHGYITREASAVAWDDVPEPNKTVMLETVKHVKREALEADNGSV